MKLLFLAPALVAGVTYQNLATTWTDASTYDSYEWNPTLKWYKAKTQTNCGSEADNHCTGGMTKIAKPSQCYKAFTKDEVKAMAPKWDQGTFMMDDRGFQSDYAYYFTAGFVDVGSGAWQPLGHGVYCPTVDPDVWINFNNEGLATGVGPHGGRTHSMIWVNNGKWNMGNPSVEWWFDLGATSSNELTWAAPAAESDNNSQTAGSPSIGACGGELLHHGGTVYRKPETGAVQKYTGGKWEFFEGGIPAGADSNLPTGWSFDANGAYFQSGSSTVTTQWCCQCA